MRLFHFHTRNENREVNAWVNTEINEFRFCKHVELPYFIQEHFQLHQYFFINEETFYQY